jgi:hypothetical protein
MQECLHISKVVADIQNKLSLRAEKGWSPSVSFGCGLGTFIVKSRVLRKVTQGRVMYLVNSKTAEPEGSTPLKPKPVIGHNLGQVPSHLPSSQSQNLRFILQVTIPYRSRTSNSSPNLSLTSSKLHIPLHYIVSYHYHIVI